RFVDCMKLRLFLRLASSEPKLDGTILKVGGSMKLSLGYVFQSIALFLRRRCSIIPARAKTMPHQSHNGRLTLMSPLVMVTRRENAKPGAIKVKSRETRQIRLIVNKTVSKRVATA